MVQKIIIFIHSAILSEFSGGGERGEENSRWLHPNLPETLNSFLRLGGKVPKGHMGAKGKKTEKD